MSANKISYFEGLKPLSVDFKDVDIEALERFINDPLFDYRHDLEFLKPIRALRAYWSLNEKLLLSLLYPFLASSDIAGRYLADRNSSAITQKAQHMGISNKANLWSDDELEKLEMNCNLYGSKAYTMIEGRSKVACMLQAERRGFMDHAK